MATSKEDEDLFEELLNGRGLEWLKKQLAELQPKEPAKTETPADFLGFLQGQLSEANKKSGRLEERLAEIMEVLTPEQLTQLRSKKEAGAAPGRTEPPTPAAPTPAAPTPAEPKKSGFLRRL